jgi:hypothetical protein
MSKKSVLSMVLVLGLLATATASWAQGSGWHRGHGMGYGMMGYGPGTGGGYGMMGYGPGTGGGYGMMGYGPGPGGGHDRMGYGPGPGDCLGAGYGPGRAARALDPEFIEETAPLRQEIFQKRAELKAVLAAQAPDEAKAKTLQEEINKLRGDMSMKRLEAMLAARKTQAAQPESQ